MPTQRIQPGMRFVDRGTNFTTVRNHALDAALWVVEYEDGHSGVFDSDWLLNLANAPAGSISRLIDYGLDDQPQMMTIPPVQVSAPPDQAVTQTSVAEVDAYPFRVRNINEAHEMAFEFELEIEDAHSCALRWELDDVHHAALLHDMRLTAYRRLPEATPEQVYRDQVAANRQEMCAWHTEALVEHRRRHPLPTCPGCTMLYEGTLGTNHRCAPITAASCSNCRAFQPSLLGVTQASIPYICQACADGGVSNCRKCGRLVAAADRGRGISKRICNDCLPRRNYNIWSSVIRAYGDNVITEIGSHLPYAVEIETFMDPRVRVDGRSTLTDVGWVESGDGSIQADRTLLDWARGEGRSGEIVAVEFKSPPLIGDGGLIKLAHDVKKIRRMGFRANNSCGLHVHVDAGGMTGEDHRAVAKFGRWYEEAMYNLVAPSRRTSQYCRPLTPTFNVANRYHWLNMASIAKHGTIEYRLHHGCTHYARVAEWAKLCVKFTEAGLRLGRSRTRPDLSLFDAIGLSAYERTYWQAISAQLYPTTPARVVDGGSTQD